MRLGIRPCQSLPEFRIEINIKSVKNNVAQTITSRSSVNEQVLTRKIDIQLTLNVTA